MIFSATAAGIAALSDASSYKVSVPDVPLNLQAPKAVSTSQTIGGGAAISVWNSSIAGQQRSFTVLVPRDTYDGLKKIHDSGVDSWLLRVQGRVFVVVFDMPEATPTRELPPRWRCTISITIESEETS